jgi:hypothetical protein
MTYGLLAFQHTYISTGVNLVILAMAAALWYEEIVPG